MRYFKFLGWAVFTLAFGALVIGFAGAVHPAFDSIAIGRLGAASVVIALAPFILGGRGALLSAGVFVAMLPLVRDRVIAGEAGEISVYSKNLYFGNEDVSWLVQDISGQSPDVVILQEVSTRNGDVLALLSGAYPNQFMCRTARWNGIAILSKVPIVVGSEACSSVRAFARVQVEGPTGPFWVVGVHLQWPWPRGQMADVKASLPVISELAGDVVVAGDFNAVPWSHAAQMIGQATGTQPVTARQTTFWMGWIPLPLDQVWSSCGGALERRPQLGSDHYGVIARVRAGNC